MPARIDRDALHRMELAIKAEMYLIDDSPTTVHRERVTWWDQWVELGNAPAGSESILKVLYEERAASRYGDRPIAMSEADVVTALDAVHVVIEHARVSCAERPPPE